MLLVFYIGLWAKLTLVLRHGTDKINGDLTDIHWALEEEHSDKDKDK